MKSICVIPARFGSTRLPGKPLLKIGGKPMIQRVYEQARKAGRLDRVIIATDHESILNTVRDFGGEVVMTSASHASGTDRVAEVMRKMDADVVINIQGDEPFISPKLLNEMAALFERTDIDIATPVHRIRNPEDLDNPNLVRVVRDTNGFALYFTRSVIPYFRDEPSMDRWPERTAYFKHIGLYAYRKETLLEITALPESSLEKAEKLEQLRMLENGYRVFTLETGYESVCVDTEADLKKINEMYTSNRIKVD